MSETVEASAEHDAGVTQAPNITAQISEGVAAPEVVVAAESNSVAHLRSSCAASKFVCVDDYALWAHLHLSPDTGTFEFEPEHGLEVETDESIRNDCRVITGLGFRAYPANVTTLRVAYRCLNSETGLLGPLRVLNGGVEPHHPLEVSIDPIEADHDDQVILTGLGARAAEGANITTFRVWTRDILPDGSLSSPVEHRYGRQKDNRLEVLVMVPDPGIIVGAGLRVADGGNVTHLRGWFGHLKPRDV